jgi:hypothetical protein
VCVCVCLSVREGGRVCECGCFEKSHLSHDVDFVANIVAKKK